MPSQTAWFWLRAQWGEVELGDERRERRAVAVGTAMADGSAHSLPHQQQSRAAAQATYRLLDGGRLPMPPSSNPTCRPPAKPPRR